MASIPGDTGPDARTFAMSHDRIPVTLLTGFLGSGKTTVLNHLVRQPDMADTLVVINEFGDVALDHLLVAHSAGTQVMELGSGCVCCTMRGDLAATLRDAAWRFARQGRRQFRRVLIETTGLADPAPILHTLMTHPQVAPLYRLDGIVATLDLATGLSSLDQHPEAVKQAAMADVLLLTKSDLADDVQHTATRQRLDGINPAAPRWVVHRGEVAAARLLGLGVFSTDGKTPDVARWLREEAYAADDAPAHEACRQDGDCRDHDHSHSHSHSHGHGHEHGNEHDLVHAANSGQVDGQGSDAYASAHAGHRHDHAAYRHDDGIRSFCFVLDAPLTQAQLDDWLQALQGLLGSAMLRVKGILNVRGQDRPLVVHGVQHVFHPPEPLPAWPDDDRRSRLVFITQGVSRETVAATLQALLT